MRAIRNLVSILALSLTASLAAAQASPSPTAPRLEEVTTSDVLFNVVTVSKQGRVFVAFPRLSDAWTPVVGEVMGDGSVRPFPGGAWNGLRPGMPTADRFVHAHSVQTDGDDDLWVVDKGNEAFGMPSLPGGPKLVRIDLTTDQVLRVYTFDPSVLPDAASLNDVQVRDDLQRLLADRAARLQIPRRIPPATASTRGPRRVGSTNVSHQPRAEQSRGPRQPIQHHGPAIETLQARTGPST